jgi:hypothetical protein
VDLSLFKKGDFWCKSWGGPFLVAPALTYILYIVAIIDGVVAKSIDATGFKPLSPTKGKAP